MAEMTHVERALRSQQLFLVCCTPTLAIGINLPVARAIVLMEEPLPSATLFTQMAGRAGRTGFGNGDCIFVMDAPHSQKWERLTIPSPSADTSPLSQPRTQAYPRGTLPPLTLLRFEPVRWMQVESLLLARPHAPLASSIPRADTTLLRYVADLLYSGLGRCVADVYLATEHSLWASKRAEWAWGVGRALISLIRYGFITVSLPEASAPPLQQPSPAEVVGKASLERVSTEGVMKDILELSPAQAAAPHPLDLASHAWWRQPLPRAPQTLFCTYRWQLPTRVGRSSDVAQRGLHNTDTVGESSQPNPRSQENKPPTRNHVRVSVSTSSSTSQSSSADVIALPLHPHLLLSPTPLLRACSVAGISPPEAAYILELTRNGMGAIQPNMLYFAFLAAPVSPVPVRWHKVLPLLQVSALRLANSIILEHAFHAFYHPSISHISCHPSYDSHRPSTTVLPSRPSPLLSCAASQPPSDSTCRGCS